MRLQLLRTVVIISTLCGVSAQATVFYVNANSLNPVPPYTNWATAAATIQDAVDHAGPADEVVVTNGIYSTGGRIVIGDCTNRVAITQPITVRSVNGPDVTIIQGYQVPGTINGPGAVRCVFMISGAFLAGFTLTGGATTQNYPSEGGGVYADLFSSALVSNCVIVGNSGYYDGGGADGCNLVNCTLSNNRAQSNGGGAFGCGLTGCTLSNNSSGNGGGTSSCGLINCVVSGNSGANGGGACNSTLKNCLLIGNSAVGTGGGAAYNSTLINCTVVGNQYSGFTGKAGGIYGGVSYNTIAYSNVNWISVSSQNYYQGTSYNCCTTPMPANGSGNFTDLPLFVDQAAGNFHLQSDSPCINSGKNDFVDTTTDLDGAPRVSGNLVDIGAYEFQSPPSLLPYIWLRHYGLPTDGSADYADTDGDGMNNWKEWRCQTDPTNALSVLKLLAVSKALSGFSFSWQSVTGTTYYVQRSTNIGLPAAFLTLQSDIAGTSGTMSYTDTNAPGRAAFYRVGVQ